jgi:hypothetical protein
LKIGTKMLRLHSSGIMFDRKIRLNNLVSQTIATEDKVKQRAWRCCCGQNY